MNQFFKKTDKSIDKSQVGDNSFIIEGTMSRPIVDFENEVIGREAYQDAINVVKERYAKGQPVPMFVEHRRKELSLPVGKLIDAWSDDNGLYFRGEIANGSIGEPIRELIKGGYLYSVSIGGDAVRTQNYFDHTINRDVKKITKMDLRELSLTGLPVNSEAVFAIAKSLNKDEKEVKLLMKSLDKAIDAQRHINSLEKAMEAANSGNLDEEALKRIKEALNNLATLLGIDVSAEGGPETTTIPDQSTQPTATSQLPPKKEETAQKEPTRQLVDANKQNDQTMEENLGQNEEDSMVKEDRLDEINSKLDKLLSHETGEKIEKDGEEDMISDDDDEEDIDGDEEDFDQDEGFDDEDSEEEEMGRKKEKHRMQKKQSKGEFMKKSLNVEGGENMEILKCRGCESEFEMSIEKSYDAKFCPHCGDRLEKSVAASDDIVCEDCGSSFEKSDEYELHYCPKCGKSMKDSSAMAVAPEPQGAKTGYKKEEKEMPKGTADAGKNAMAVAPEPDGAKTQVKAEEKKPTGSSVEEFKDGNYIDGVDGKGDAGPGQRADKRDEDINEPRPSGKPLLSTFDAGKVSNYGKDRLGKSEGEEDRITKLEKAIETLQVEKSAGRQSLVPEAVETTKKVEKSQASQEDIDRSFAKMLLKK